MKNKRSKIYDYIILITVTIIIVIFAYPIYRNYVISTKRTEAKFTLLNLIGAMERHYSKYNTYKSATIDTDPATDVLGSNITIGNWYKVEIINQTDHDYILKAIPQNQQAIDDIKCGTLIISKFGEKKISGTGSLSTCWK